MLIGNHKAKFSREGRTAIPKKFLHQLGEELVLLQGYEQCLVMVPAHQLEHLMAADQPFMLSSARETERFLLGNAFEVRPDKQGRVVIPPALREYAQLDGGELIFVGLGNRVEIWNVNKWQEYQQYLKQNSDQIASKLMEYQQNHDK